MVDQAVAEAQRDDIDRWGMLPFAMEVYRERLDFVQTDIRSRGLAGALLFDPENIYWLTGYQTIGYFTFHALFIGPQGPPVVVGRIVTRDLAMAHPTIGGFEAVVDTADHIDVLTDFLQSRSTSGQSIGLETRAWYLTVKDYLRLSQTCDVDLVEWNGVIEPKRPAKSDAEIGRMRHAARCAEAGLEAAIAAVAPGKTENDIAAAMHQASIAAGSEYLGHPPLVVTGETTALCFAMWRRREIRRGDVVVLETAGCIDRYHAMLSRPVVVGKPTQRHREAADALQGVLEAAISAIKPGLTSGGVDQACRKVVEDRGLGKYFRHRSAYGIGIGLPPNWSEGHIYAIRPDDPLVLEPNMTFHVIPTLFLDDFGMCFSDSVRVTETGCELLTNFPRKLFIVDD
ncbi:MAG: Xaa-Pro peptidase family protein [Hyphomicrobiales bacterium]|nr:Xaa-Pro peptidase family protein [Hyphomicrobiales bacterium]